MTMPPLPSQGSNDWQEWAEAVHDATTDVTAGAFVSSGGSSGVHVDLDRPVNPAQRWMQETISVTITGDLVLTLGATPIDGKVALWVKSGSSAPARLLPSGYTVDDGTVTITALTAGNTVLLEYFYDADESPDPASATSNQYTFYDEFARTVSASSTPADFGAAITGQSVYGIFGSGTWAMDGTTVYKSAAGTVAAQDCIYWNVGAADGWFETVLDSTTTATAPAGIALRGTNSSTLRIHTLVNGMSVRVSGTDTRQFTSTQSFGAGDGVGVLAQGANFKLYRRANNAGPWVYIGEFTLSTTISDANPTLLTSTIAGFRNAEASPSTQKVAFQYLKVIANATQPPAAA